jgi:predicted ATPase
MSAGRPRQGAASGVVEQVVAKTDGVPLFVEELTKMVLEWSAPGGAGALG